RHRRQRARRRAADGLGANRDDLLAAEPRDGLLELLREPRAVGFRRFVGATITILVAGSDMRDVDQQRRELPSAPLVATHGERPQCVAVIALAPGDEMPALRLADFHEVLACKLE